jgi:hypothetical protein
MIRSAWVDSYVTSQQLVGLSNHREITSADMELFKSFDDRLKQHMASYQATIRDPADQTALRRLHPPRGRLREDRRPGAGDLPAKELRPKPSA